MTVDERAGAAARFPHNTMTPANGAPTSHPMKRRSRLLSKVVGYYQSVLRHCFEHFFPDATLESVSDRVFINAEDANRGRVSCTADEDGISLNLQWFRSSFRFRPGSPAPFLPSEVRLVQTILRVLAERYQALYDPEVAERSEWLRYPVEDMIVARYVDHEDGDRIPAALETLRVAGLSTYENRRLSSGALLLGTAHDPTAPERTRPYGSPRYGVRLAAVKSFHRLCDGINTLFVVDREGNLTGAVDIARWADQAQGTEPLSVAMPCPKPYHAHAKATRSGHHVAVVLTPHQEIKVFAAGTMMFAFSDARWRLLDIPSKFELWRRAVGTQVHPPDLAARIFRAALNLSENRHGAMFVLLRDPDASLNQLVAHVDQLSNPAPEEADDPENSTSPRMAKQAIQNLARGVTIQDLDPSVLESLAQVDGAVVMDLDGRLLAFGAILRLGQSESISARAVEGARTAAAIASSLHGPVLKVSEDGFLTMFLGGRRIWEI